MKIAMIGHKRIPGREGGIEVVVEELATGLASKGHKVTVYNRRKKGLKIPKEYKGVKLISVPTIEKKSTDAIIYSFLASIHAAIKDYDVIHYHAIGPSFFIFIPHLFKKKIIVTVHGLNYKTPKWSGFGAWFIKKGEQFTAKYADKIIVLSQEQKRYFKNTYNRETEYIPNGTQLMDVIPVEIIKKEYGLTKGNYILFLSRVVPGKGVEYLLEAYRQINSNLKLVIAGDSPFLNDFHKKISEMAKKDERVKLIGFVEGKKLQELYSNAKLFVFPSEAEGMPICLLEALSYNCECLVSDIPENLEVGKNYVHTFKSCNVEDLKEQLEKMLTLQRKVNNSREYIKQHYSWDTNIRKTLKCYGELKCH